MLPRASNPPDVNPERRIGAPRRHILRNPLLWSALLVLLTCGYYRNTRPGWNANSQFALACAIAEHATLRIDAYHQRPDMRTGDKARYEGHVYSDKSPVTAFLAVPVVWTARRVCTITNIPFRYGTVRWLATWLVVGGAAALVAVLTGSALAARGVPRVRAARAGALWVAATPLLGYAVIFFNYLPACAMALGGLRLVEGAWGRPGSTIGIARLGAGGFLLGLAAWTLHTMGLVAMALTLGLVVGITPGLASGAGRWLARCLRLWPWVVGGGLGAAGYFIYTYALFGTFTSPYAYEANPFFRQQMAQGFMGAGWPDPQVAWLITFHPFSGLFFWWPLTLPAAMGLIGWLFRGGRPDRIEAAAGLLVLAGLILYTSGYFMWWGGRAYAPRHLIPALPLVGLGLAPFLSAQRRWIPAGVFLVGLASLAFNLWAVGVDPQIEAGLPQQALMQPDRVFFWPSLWLRLIQLRPGLDHNWGQALGLEGLTSLLPLAVLWAAGWWVIGRSARTHAPRPTGSTPRQEASSP